ncbi:MBOAT family protein [Roseomonas alkaliterrae]|uniref:Probable alginate O-acetylase AlgI n=1 Tax=Neoroseomonas alkaliterrae TaxID=1452450 RepID=A0A840XHN5_9PROT|nr:D-alanyl-lipoteichoic acid acyltransferase DltB (MBOAT superfamily) [Neoroseomonas alkaliterrae]MBR0676918.1 MBOAT family protein [Neoroseomonas alkaliterrae]
MLFQGQAFILLFLPVTLALYYAAAGSRTLRQIVAVAASLVFYGFWDVRFVPLLAGLTLANWLFGRWHIANPRRDWAAIGIALNLATLGVFKFTNFFAASFAAVLGATAPSFDIILPLGISFFTFQKISYLMDVRRGDRHAYGLLDFFMFVTFFPQLVAGPIVRHNEIIAQFATDPRRAEMWENLSRGLALFCIGAAKKLLIADHVSEVADRLFAQAAAGPLGAAEAWGAAWAFTLQIYFDFSGYSDMAIGLALMFGLRLPYNFDAPYRATSIRDFWRRWHMTLSRFLRDYLYIPLGGNRGGGLLQARNVVVTMLLAGLWHGAAWTFVAWGGLHGVALAINGAWQRAGLRMPAVMGWALTLLFVMAGWVLFRAPDFATAITIWRGMAGLEGLGGVKLDHLAAFLAGSAAALLGPTSQQAALMRLRPAPWLAVPVGVALLLLILQSGTRAPSEFIYFQF